MFFDENFYFISLLEEWVLVWPLDLGLEYICQWNTTLLHENQILKLNVSHKYDSYHQSGIWTWRKFD